jgi:hypothetical protein
MSTPREIRQARRASQKYAAPFEGKKIVPMPKKNRKPWKHQLKKGATK